MITIDRKDGVVTVRYDRGERRNAFSLEAMQRLTEVAEQLRDDPETACVVLTGSDAAFSAGVDLKDPARWEIADRSLAERRHVALWGSRMCKAWEEVPQLTIAAVEGFNVGGGIALTLACDWRVMSNSAFLLVPEARIGIPLGWHTVPRLVNLVGPARAKRIILTNERMDAATAFDWGLADWLSEPGQALSLAQELAATVAENPVAVTRMTKQSVNAYANAMNHVATFMDVDQALLCNQSEEALAARKAFSKA